MKRLIRKAQITTFYHGSPLPRALRILEANAINSINSQGEGAVSIQNVSLQNNAIYITTDKQSAFSYAARTNPWGIIFEFDLNTDNEPIIIDEDTFYWGEGLDSEENRETFEKMFDGDKEQASNFVKNLVDNGFFNNRTGYDPYDDENFDIKQDEFVGIDENGHYYLDLSGLQFANVEIANEIIKMIPFENQMKANDNTFAYHGDINLSKIKTMYLVSNTNEEYEFTNKDELIAKYTELTKKES